MSKVYLVLANGRIFEGESFGAVRETVGELICTTSATGFLAEITDPVNYGKILLSAFPGIGNYGVISSEMESEGAQVYGVVAREVCEFPSNHRSEGALGDFLKKQGVPGICGIDTREIVQIIREQGSMNAMITGEKPAQIPQNLLTHRETVVTGAVSVKTPKRYTPVGDAAEIALIDFGSHRKILQELLECGCAVTVFPYDTGAEEIMASKPRGVVLGNGAGNPEECEATIETVKKLCGKFPIAGFSFGHVILATAAGLRAEKMPYGHRGSNIPVRESETGLIYITSQNHGYTVNEVHKGGIPAEVIYTNINDGSCEGISYPSISAFSLQFMPGSFLERNKMKYSIGRFLSMAGGVR